MGSGSLRFRCSAVCSLPLKLPGLKTDGERILGPRGQCHHTGGGRLPQARAATQLIQPPLRLSSEVTGWRREVTGNLPASAGYL